jgi:16S rRNA (guanine527-N7)-methyltransferase
LFHVEQDQIQLSDLLKKSAAELCITVPDSALSHFYEYLLALKKWNKAVNLTAIHDDQGIVVKHFVDSLAGLKVIAVENEIELLDVGAGAGFPAIPLKLVQPSISIELLEPSGKKSSFLRYVVGSLGLRQVTVVAAKLEDYSNQRRSQRLFDYIVVRAFKVDTMGVMLRNLLKDKGKVVLFRATKTEHGFKLDSLDLIEEFEYDLPSGYGHRTLSVFSKQSG